MRTLPLRKFGVVLLAAVFLASMAGVSSSVTYTLRVGLDNVVMPDNAVIPAWKIAKIVDAGAVGDNVLRFPGPTLVGTVGDNLVITLVNGLTVDNTSTAGPGHSISLVIPGLALPVVVDNTLPQRPVFDNNTPPRVLSYVEMTPAGNGTRTYRFALMKPGTFLYESGADPSVQVAMGIHGALIVRPANPAQAYPPTATNPNTAFDNEAVLLYSAIDPFLHHAVGDNTYGTAAFPSSINYEPKYFLLNGKPYQNQADPLISHHTPVSIGPPGGNGTLLRFLNAGSIGLAPSFLGAYVTQIGEDGNLLPYPRVHHTLLLTAGKTLDVLLVPTTPAGMIPLIDRRLSVTNNGVYPGGLLTLLAAQGADATGPATTFTSFTPPPTAGISPVLLTAAAADSAAGNNPVVAAEWMTDNTVREGYGSPMAGTFGTPVVSNLTAYVSLSAVPADNTLWIRSQDAEGNWSLPVPVVVVRGAASPLVVTETNFVGGQKLIVKATSNAVPAGSDTLTVTGFGTMVYRSGLGIYEGEFWRVDAQPETVTITSTATGSSVTAPVPFP